MANGYTTFGDWVRHRRRLLDLTQAGLATRSFYSEVTIRNIEKDALRPAEAGALQLASALAIPERYLPVFVDVARGKRPLTDLPLPQAVDETVSSDRSRMSQHSAYAYLIDGESAHLLEGERAHTLFGRRELLDKAHRLLDKRQHIVLQGAGGRGKTALAAEIAYERANATQDSAVWVHVGEDTADYVFLVIGELFEAQRAIAQQSKTQVRAKLVCDLLHRAGVHLIILDNVWDGEVLTTLMQSLPRSITVLVTSQLRFPLDEGVMVEMEDLLPRDALQLLSSALHKDVTQSSMALALCQRLGFLPLALIMAGKTMYTDKLSVDEYLAEIQDYPHLTEMPLLVQPGHESMTAVIEISLHRLSDHTRQVFLAFGGLYAPSVTADLLAMYMKRPRTALLRELTILYRRGLIERIVKVTPGVSQYQLHSLTFSYTREEFRGGGRSERTRLITACRNYVAVHKDNPDEIHAERVNVLNAAAKAYEIGQEMQLIDIMRILAIDSPYLVMRGHDTLLLEQLDNAILSLEKKKLELDDTERQRLEHFLLGKRGNIHYDYGELTLALDCYQQSLVIAERLNMVDRQSILHSVMSKVCVDKKAFDDALLHLTDSRELALQLGSDTLLMRTMENEGYYYAQGLKDFERARSVFVAIKKLAEQHGDKVALFHALLNLGSTYHDTQDFDEAIPLFEQALAVAEQAGFQCWKADCLFALAMSHDDLGHKSLAADFFRNAGLQFQDCGMIENLRKVQDEMMKRGYAVSSVPNIE